VKSTIHWVSAEHALDAEVRLYETLFKDPDPSVTQELNPHSLEILNGAKVEPSLRDAPPLSRFQFERLGYFCVDRDSFAGSLAFNRTVALRDTWAKIEKRGQ
jgi:glutaminyl-tRNA synthetase